MSGAPGSYTLAGPPDRMIALGSMARSDAASMLPRTTSENVPRSRTRRAMRRAYWPPRSSTITG